jgi:adenylosuccinate lyase
MTYSHEAFLSPFTWRYGSAQMRALWSEAHTRRLWRRLWVALAEAQAHIGLVRPEQAADLKAHQDAVDLARAHAIEAEIKHDLMAEVRTYAEQCTIGGGIIHLGATSTDIEDNATALQLRAALDLLIAALADLLRETAKRIHAEADHVCMAFTHLQPATPTTIGHRLASYGQDLLGGWEHLVRLRGEVRGKGFKGAVGTAASYAELLHGTATTPAQLEAAVMEAVGLPVHPITTQTYPRRQDYLILCGLADVALSLHRFAFDLRLLQSSPIGEWAEPFGAAQVGSSAMPFKRNPINAENIDSLARFVGGLPAIAWQNAAVNLLERTLDDSANRRAILPEAFLATEEIIVRAGRLMKGLRIDAEAVRRNVAIYGVFSATERLLMEAVRAGGDRQAIHEVIRIHSLAAWEALQQGKANPLVALLGADAQITTHVPPARLAALMDASAHIGDAPLRARAMANHILAQLDT